MLLASERALEGGPDEADDRAGPCEPDHGCHLQEGEVIQLRVRGRTPRSERRERIERPLSDGDAKRKRRRGERGGNARTQCIPRAVAAHLREGDG